MQKSISHKDHYNILRSMLWFAVACGFLLSLTNVVLGNYSLAVFEVIIVLICTFGLCYLPRIKQPLVLRSISRALAITLLSLMLYAFNLPDVSQSIFIWALLIPLISYHLTGLIFGFSLTAIFIVLSCALFVFKSGITLQTAQLGPVLNVLICTFMIWVITHSYELLTSRNKKQLLKLATKDPLTDLLNRSTLRQVFQNHQNQTLGFILLDIDWFKRINDNYGHDVGDDVLIRVATAMRSSVKPSDYVFRLGGEEFAVLLPQANHENTHIVATAIINTIAKIKWSFDPATRITASAGIATNPHEANNLSDLMKLADQRMYIAKQNGKNQVVTSSY